jgi:predicted metalloendopeptidase
MNNLKVWACIALWALVSLGAARPAGDLRQAGFNPANIDSSCQPCDDFNQFANGGWLAKNPIPAAYPSWGSFNILNESNRENLRQILAEKAKEADAPKGSVEQKIGDYYAACMDEPAIEATGLRPLSSEFARIDNIQDAAGLRATILYLQSNGAGALFKLGSTQDFKNSTEVIGEIDQGGLGLPDRDYYIRDDEKSQKLREQYVAHIAKMFELLGDNSATAAAEAKTVMELETRLANASLTKVERRDPEKLYHRMKVSEVRALAPEFVWNSYLRDAVLDPNAEINVATPEFFKEVSRMLDSVPMSDWKTYLRWTLIDAAAPRLSAKFVDEDFDFNGRILTGTTENLARWKRCVSRTNGALGEALGQSYVEKYFKPQAKARALEMVHNLEAVLRDDIQGLPWMGAGTKKQALVKLNAIVNKIGYPDKWRDYSTLHVDRGSHALNAFRAEEFEFKRQLAKVGKPVDRAEWGMSPPTVNAYYNPQLNEIVFPAGILQPPFFGAEADDAFNYGGMGAVIGHELIHGFDDQGSQFDAEGNLRNWWTEEDRKKFEELAECVRKQFDAYEVEKGLNQNGKLVLGESLADQGGLNIAYAAYQKALEKQGARKDIGGFTSDQRFFMGYARVWATNMRPEFARLLTNGDPHPLPRFRVIGTVSNMPEFARAFDCKAGDGMVRPSETRCRVW